MDEQRKDKKSEVSDSFRKFKELTKNLLAVSNKEAREQEAANKPEQKEKKRAAVNRAALSNRLCSSLALDKSTAALQPIQVFSQTCPYHHLCAH